jgi:hypothetical protein
MELFYSFLIRPDVLDEYNQTKVSISDTNRGSLSIAPTA